MDLSLFEEMKRYVGLADEDLRLLNGLREPLRPHLPPIVDDFYARILATPALRSLIADDAQVARLKGTLAAWLEGVFASAFDAEHLELRSRIGLMHVRIGLAPVYVIAAMSVIRIHLQDALSRLDAPRKAEIALSKALDLELGILLGSYETAMQDQVRKLERLSTIGQLAASVNHDLKTPLGAISTSLYLLRGVPGVAGIDEASRHLDTIQRNTNQAQRVISSLLDYVRERQMQFVDLDLSSLVTEVLAEMFLPPDVQTSVDAPTVSTRLRGDQVGLSRIVTNLVQNSAEAMDWKGTIRFSFREDRGDVIMQVKDSGPGIPAAHLQKVFDPLFSTKPSGTGLGLATCWNIVRAHGGAVEAQSPPGGGALFVIRLPRAGRPSGDPSHA